jgi:hypothetical protein
MLLEEDLEELGDLRLLEVSIETLFVIPCNTHIRLLVSSTDVLHSWAVPSFGIKVDACPGRLNIVNLFIDRTGTFYGQCSEICGINHSFMPICIYVEDVNIYLNAYTNFFYQDGYISCYDDNYNVPNLVKFDFENKDDFCIIRPVQKAPIVESVENEEPEMVDFCEFVEKNSQNGYADGFYVEEN